MSETETGTGAPRCGVAARRSRRGIGDDRRDAEARRGRRCHPRRTGRRRKNAPRARGRPREAEPRAVPRPSHADHGDTRAAAGPVRRVRAGDRPERLHRGRGRGARDLPRARGRAGASAPAPPRRRRAMARRLLRSGGAASLHQGLAFVVATRRARRGRTGADRRDLEGRRHPAHRSGTRWPRRRDRSSSSSTSSAVRSTR